MMQNHTSLFSPNFEDGNKTQSELLSPEELTITSICRRRIKKTLISSFSLFVRPQQNTELKEFHSGWRQQL
ncbi:hypothetical protein L6452_19265 [Arctium lappa]|uniref:Uncharacterized protein n=1 Tax=Arctium lappa TaxID=4217 RepID=A0ACB9B9B6_ARCLA|nr:hypothetical protein L6452_19265 [Arctium lappa]